MKTWVLALLVMLMSVGAHAQQADLPKGIVLDPTQFPPPVELNLPDKYIVSNGIASNGASTKETTKAVNGLVYTVVAPIFDGSDQNISFIRMGNANSFSVTFTVLVVGNMTGKLYGTALYTVQPYAAPQVPYSQILSRAGFTGLTGADTGYVFYMRTGQFYTGFQHVIFNLDSLFFENASLCTFNDNLIYSGLNQVMVDVHTSIVGDAGYPAILFLHNYSSATVTYRGFVFESETGTQKGTITTTLGPNQSYVFPWSDVQTGIGWTPGATEGHANIIWQRADGGTFTGLVGQSIYNQKFKAYVNMSIICPMNN